jgi:hypothetical protein
VGRLAYSDARRAQISSFFLQNARLSLFVSSQHWRKSRCNGHAIDADIISSRRIIFPDCFYEVAESNSPRGRDSRPCLAGDCEDVVSPYVRVICGDVIRINVEQQRVEVPDGGGGIANVG